MTLKIFGTKRGKVAIAAALTASVLGAWTGATGDKKTTPIETVAQASVDRGVSPVQIRLAIKKGITPPAVKLAIDVLIKNWEGLRLNAYYDSVRKATVCFGETLYNGKPVKIGMSFTRDECVAMLTKRVINDYYLPLVDSVPGFTAAPYSLQASMISGAYNFGVAGQRHSKSAGFVTQRQWSDACVAQTAWTKAGGKDLPGLVARRGMGDKARPGEGEVCESGLKE